MIKKISLKNFQAHEDTVIEPAASLTSITGKSDQGKTSIVRAIKKVQTNRPLGSAFVRHGETGSALTIDDVTIVTTGSKTTYILDKDKTFTALRGAVPDEVTEKLRLGPDNIQEQHNPPFMLDTTPGKVAQKLSELVDLEQANNALKYIASKKRALNSEIEATRTSIDATNQVIEDLGDIEAINEEYVKIERKWAKVDVLNKTRSQAYTAIQNARGWQIELSKTHNVCALMARLVDLHKDIITIKSLKRDANLLDSVIDNASTAEGLIRVDYSKVLKQVNKALELHSAHTALQGAVITATKQSKNLSKIGVEQQQARQDWESYAGETCPLCGGEL